MGDESAPRPENSGESVSVPQTMLKALVKEKHLSSYRRFKRAYQEAARTVDRDLVDSYPSQMTYRRWMAGQTNRPRAEHCAVLEAMFPGWIVADLFAPYVPPEKVDNSTLLRELLRRRHLETYRAFCQAYDKAAVTLDKKLIGTYPAERQFYRWISGEMIGLPYPDHCNVLEIMFPGYSARQLFDVHSETNESSTTTVAKSNEQAEVRSEEIDSFTKSTTVVDGGSERTAVPVVPAQAESIISNAPAKMAASGFEDLGLPGYSARQLFEPFEPTQVSQRETVSSSSPIGGALPAGEMPIGLDNSNENVTLSWAQLGPLIDVIQSARSLAGDGAYEQLMTLLRGWMEDMKRREVLRALGSTAITIATSPFLGDLNADEQDRIAGAIATPSRVDDTVIGHIEDVLWSVMRQDDALGPHAVLDTVLSQRKLVGTIMPECPSRLRPRLLSLLSNLSRFAGWLSFDLNSFDAASRYYEQARISAHEAENTDLSVFVLCQLSHLATWQGRPRVGIDHAIAAQNWAKDTDDLLLRAYTADIAARAYSADGNRRACMDALESAHRELERVRTPHTPATSLAYFNGQGQFAGTRCECLLNLSDTSSAVNAANESLALIDQSFVRNYAFGLLYLGDTYIAAQEIEEAARIVGDGAALAARNRSTRLIDMLGRSRASLRKWQDTPAVRELDDQLMAYGLLPSSTT